MRHCRPSRRAGPRTSPRRPDAHHLSNPSSQLKDVSEKEEGLATENRDSDLLLLGELLESDDKAATLLLVQTARPVILKIV